MHGNTRPHGLRVLGEELCVHLVHGREVGHVREEDVHLDDVVQAASCLFEDGGEVEEGLALGGLVMLFGEGRAEVYSAVTDAAWDQGFGGGGGADAA